MADETKIEAETENEDVEAHAFEDQPRSEEPPDVEGHLFEDGDSQVEDGV